MIRAAMRPLAAVLAASVATPANAFGTLGLGGYHSEHRDITKFALSERGFGPNTMKAFAGGGLRFGAVGAPDKPGRGYFNVTKTHCDSGDWLDPLAFPGYPQSRQQANDRIKECRAWIFERLAAAVDEAGLLADENAAPVRGEAPAAAHCRFDGKAAPARCKVLDDMGLSLHALQDFYSHTNWVDAARPQSPVSPASPPGLGGVGPAPFLANISASFPEGLMSGCYIGIIESRSCAYPGGRRVRHADLNKDKAGVSLWKVGLPLESVQGATPRGRADGNFGRAASAAVQDTAIKWTMFETRVTARYGPKRGAMILCLLKSDTPLACPASA